MTKEQSEFYERLCELTGEEVAQAFLNWHGTQLLTEDFINDVNNEYFTEEN